MCRSIHTLYHTDPPVTVDEIHAASLQFVRKISGYSKPSKANEAAFEMAVGEIEATSAKLLASLVSNSPMRERSKVAGLHREVILQSKRVDV